MALFFNCHVADPCHFGVIWRWNGDHESLAMMPPQCETTGGYYSLPEDKPKTRQDFETANKK